MQIRIISRPCLDSVTINKFLSENRTAWRKTNKATEAELLIEFAGRVCYLSFGTRQSPKSNKEYIRNLIVSGHESVLEHASWTFVISGVSRAFSHQLVRHRVGMAFSQLSQQYHDENNAEFVEPWGLKDFPEAMKLWKSSVKSSLDSYRSIEASIASSVGSKLEFLSKKELNRLVRTTARSVLPNGTETKLVVTANARSLRHFLKVRGAIKGDSEMRFVSAQLLKLLQKEAPSVFFDFHLGKLSDGSPEVTLQSST